MSTLGKFMRSKSRLTLFSAALLVILSFACYGMSESQVELQASQHSIFSSATENDSEGKTLTVTVDGTNLRFSPDVITLVEGDTVRFFWENQLLAHNAVEENGLFDSGDPERNVEYNYTFQVGENGTYQYVCEPHASLGMVGTIIVEPMPVLEPEPVEPTEDEDDSIALSVGSGEISAFFFTPWFIGVFVLIGFISTRREQFHLDLVLEDEIEAVLVDDDGKEVGETLVDSYRARVLTLCALYIAQGIPFGFMTVTFVTFLAAEGFSAKELALLLTLGTLPWSLKFIWGPMIDRYQYRPMGRRRPWILVAQSGMILVLTCMVLFIDPEKDIKLIAYAFLFYNIFVSIQDVSTDALAVDVLKPHEIEKVNSYMFTSKTLGALIGGAGLGTIISFTGITGALLIQIPILLVIMLVPLYMRERPGEKQFPWSPDSGLGIYDEEREKDNKTFREIASNFRIAFSLKSTRLGILLSLVLCLSYFLIPVLPLLFVRELGWSEEKFNATKGGLILLVTMFGYIFGGMLGKRFGGKSVIIYSTLAGALISLVWGLTEGWWSSTAYLVSIWCIHTFVFAMVSMNVFSLMMRITWSEIGGTQFTTYMALMNLSAIIGYQLTDPLASRFDYTTLFLIAAVLETLMIGAALFIDPNETRRALGVSSSPSDFASESIQPLSDLN
ncbi:MAG: hypothetical protein CMB55_00475 [Euryarchaeota archaeon]|nr:hypothetical protein [Euryarchaeota archaeon]